MDEFFRPSLLREIVHPKLIGIRLYRIVPQAVWYLDNRRGFGHREKHDIDTVMKNIASYELSLDRKKMMVRKDNSIFVIPADGSAPSDLDSKRVKLDDWSFSLDPRREWKQMFSEAWRLEPAFPLCIPAKKSYSDHHGDFATNTPSSCHAITVL